MSFASVSIGLFLIALISLIVYTPAVWFFNILGLARSNWKSSRDSPPNDRTIPIWSCNTLPRRTLHPHIIHRRILLILRGCSRTHCTLFCKQQAFDSSNHLLDRLFVDAPKNPRTSSLHVQRIIQTKSFPQAMKNSMKTLRVVRTNVAKSKEIPKQKSK